MLQIAKMFVESAPFLMDPVKLGAHLSEPSTCFCLQRGSGLSACCHCEGLIDARLPMRMALTEPRLVMTLVTATSDLPQQRYTLNAVPLEHAYLRAQMLQ